MKSDRPLYNSSAKSNEENSDIKRLLNEFVGIWPFVLCLLLINLSIAYYIGKVTTPTYQVAATMVINQDKNPVSTELFESIGLKPVNNIENEIAVLNSFSVAYTTLNQLDFNVEYFTKDIWQKREAYHSLPYKFEVDWNHGQILDGEFEVRIHKDGLYSIHLKTANVKRFDPSNPEEKLPGADVTELLGKHKLNEWINGRNCRIRLVKSGYSDATVSQFLFRLRSNFGLAADYSKMLKVDVAKKESTVLSLSLQTSNVEKGKKYLDKIIEVYQARELNNKNRTATNTASFINAQLKGIKDSLAFFEDKLQHYRSDSKSFNLEQQSSLVLTRLSDLEEERANTALKIKYYQSVLSYLEKDEIAKLVVPSTVGINETVLDQLINELISIQNDKLRLGQFLATDNKTVKDLNFRYTTVLNTLKESITRSYKAATLSLTDLDKRIAELNGDLNSMPKEERDMLSIKRQSTISENIYTYMLQKRDEAEISRASNTPSSEVLDFARQSGGMISPKPVMNYAIAISLGLMFPLMFLFLRSFFNSRIYDSKTLEQRLSVPLLGSIGKSFHKGSNTVVFDMPKSFIAENFRSIRASTQFLHPMDKSMVIAVSSSVSNEGKTFCSINLASIYALGGKKTVLVGVDLRKPKIAYDFGMENNIGVSNYLSGNMELSSIIKKSKFETLDVILSGTVPPNPAELIGSPRFGEMIELLKEEYDVIILDCPPAGLVSETIDIFSHSDLNFYIFRHLNSDWDSIELLNDLCEKGLLKKAYAIYNGVTHTAKYGYGYQYYAESEDQSSFWKKLRQRVAL